jgi:transposase
MEPPDHAIGRSRGGVTCKIHLAADGRGRPLGLVLTGGHAADTSFLPTVLDTISVGDGRPGRPRTRPDRVLADKACTSAANRRYLAGRGIKVTIPERDDQKANRVRRGAHGGRPRTFDAEVYKLRNVVERCFNKLKQWRGIATRYDKTHAPTWPVSPWPQHSSGPDDDNYQHGLADHLETLTPPVHMPYDEVRGFFGGLYPPTFGLLPSFGQAQSRLADQHASFRPPAFAGQAQSATLVMAG